MTADDVKRILVVGAGQMGAQIAMQSALHGYQITLNDLNMELLQKGMAGNRKQLERRVQKGQMTRRRWNSVSITRSGPSSSATSRASTSATTHASRPSQ
jgi:3-hydroxybutyryl-CoA dehydrogenase